MKNSIKLIIAFVLGLNLAALACSPLNVPILVSQTVTPTTLSLNWNSTTPYHCADAIDVEIACSGSAFSGLAAYTYTSATITGSGTTYSYPTQTINISNLCPGAVYQFRARERNNPGSTASLWSSTFTFTMPGVFIPPTATLTANPPVITLCPQGQSTLSFNCSNCCGNPPYNYTWTPGSSLSCSTCATPVATPTVTTIYTLTSKGGQLGCWSLTNTVQVTVITTPPIVGTASISVTSMCAGNPVSVSMSTYSGAIQWQSSPNAGGPWTNLAGANTGTFITAPLNSSTYYQALVTGCGGTLTSNVVGVTVNPNPTVTVNSPSICAGSTANLIANGATSYVWSAGATSTGVNTANASPVVTTNYTVTGTTAGCTGSAVATVTVKPMPVPVANNNGPVCTGGALNLTSGGGGTYSWSGPGGYSSALQNPVISPVALTDAGAYIVTVNLAGCIASATTNVVITTPTASAANSGPYCAGQTINLNSNSAGGTGYTWTGPAGFNSAVQNPNRTNATAGMSGIYSTTINLGTCVAMASTSVTVYALPTPSITSNSPVCIGQPINFTGNGGVQYAWIGPGFVSNNQNPTIFASAMNNNGTFTLNVVDANNCANSVTAFVVVNAQPVVAATGATVCENGNSGISAVGGISYNWSGPNGFTSSAQNPTMSNSQVNQTGVYTVLVTDANTCTNTATANFTVYAQPMPNIQSNSPICINNILALSGTGGVSYYWTGPNGFSSTAQNPTVNANSVAYSGNYSLTVTDGAGCTASTGAAAVINPVPNVSVLSSINKGCPPLCVSYTAVASPSITTYNWIMGDGSTSTFANDSRCYNTPGIYSLAVTVTDVNGCTNVTSYTTEVYPKPVADFNYAPLLPVENDEVSFTDATYSAVPASWSWYFMNTANATSNAQNPTFVYADHGNYAIVLVAKSNHGCIDTVMKTILVGEDFGIYLPNAFTPNNDGLNDVFNAKGHGITKFEMSVYDRYGKEVFASTDINEAWDGSHLQKGNKVIMDGVYTWRVKVTNVFGKSKELTGHVTLIK